mmetsp:Transcript_3075/g.9382  ORF Transcript_3075/g.9382 Transcript_3075/m.9382 type:complete len:536 (-) Transcript_3075:99-1706(-)|eukprot:CAMPEP_0198723132 /NCGR_PEP_ID=MMETSP1475-20131203/678_1 /TAXON_ID= ORGANISM="Unidentified sp., Strain CCMP1999" /NCGR_SAMPLE_ID=MMETSP1475 /ASSEMBLY_ACC=CAM_ASM_001111 /LENGTH=535 /DNA_ID=CAMNT_0044484147 /DNA_START=581 /DNA_END=2188 /DNA_ORIENTATION=+
MKDEIRSVLNDEDGSKSASAARKSKNSALDGFDHDTDEDSDHEDEHPENNAKRRKVILNRRKRQLAYLARKKKRKSMLREEVLEQLADLYENQRDAAVAQLYASVMSAANPVIQQRRLTEAITVALSVFPASINVKAAAFVLHVPEDLAEKFFLLIGQSKAVKEDSCWHIVSTARQLKISRNAGCTGLIKVAKADFCEYFTKIAARIAVNCFKENGATRKQHLQDYINDRFNFEHICNLPDVDVKMLNELAYLMRQCTDAALRAQLYLKVLERTEWSSCAETNIETAILRLSLAESFFDSFRDQEALEMVKKSREVLETSYRQNQLQTLRNKACLFRARLLEIQLLNRTDGVAENRRTESEELLESTVQTFNNEGLSETSLMVEALLISCLMCIKRHESTRAGQAVSHICSLVDLLQLENTAVQALVKAVLGAYYATEQKLDLAEENLKNAAEILMKWASLWSHVSLNHCLDLEVFILEGLAKIRNQKMDASAQDTARQAMELARLQCMPESYTSTSQLLQDSFTGWIDRLRTFP